MIIGYNLCSIDDNDLLLLLNYAKKNKLRIYHLKKDNHQYTFYISSFQLYYWHKCDIDIQYLKNVGLMKYIFLFKGVYSLIVISGFVLGLLLFSHLIFRVDIQGTLKDVNVDMYQSLKEYNVFEYAFKRDYEQLNDLLIKLKDKYKDQIEYINIYQQGGIFYVEYTNKKRIQQKEIDFKNIYASKDGMIESFDIESGNIVVKRLDYVKKGDLLVENTLIATDDTVKTIPVKGKVYAYTFNQYEASIVDKGQDYLESFYHLLLLIRMQLPADVVIDKENVLQIERSSSKITLKMHYTLLEDIALKKEN